MLESKEVLSRALETGDFSGRVSGETVKGRKTNGLRVKEILSGSLLFSFFIEFFSEKFTGFYIEMSFDLYSKARLDAK